MLSTETRHLIVSRQLKALQYVSSESGMQDGDTEMEIASEEQPPHYHIPFVTDLSSSVILTGTPMYGLETETPPPVISELPSHSCNDPLQTEYERLLMETEQTNKTHEEIKLKLKSDCEREIEEVARQIRSKYEIKLEERESEFQRRKKELYAIQNKVLRNKFLAEAFYWIKENSPGISEEPEEEEQLAMLLSSHDTAQRDCILTSPTSSSGSSAATLQAYTTATLGFSFRPILIQPESCMGSSTAVRDDTSQSRIFIDDREVDMVSISDDDD